MMGLVRAICANLLVICVLAVAPARAHAGTDFPCAAVDNGTIQVDGLLDDWSGKTVTAGSGDSAFVARCAYDKSNLYLAIDVTDDRLIRTKTHGHDEDHLVLGFAGKKLEIYPASAEYGAKLFVSWPKPVVVVDSLQKHGWSVEL